MTDKQIEEQVKAIKQVTRDVSTSREKAAAFLKSAGIPSTPPVRHGNDPKSGHRK